MNSTTPIAPCEWPLSYLGCEGGCSALDSLSDEDREAVEAMATSLLWEWTGRRFGRCPDTIRPQVLDWCEVGYSSGSFSTFEGSGPYAQHSDGYAGAAPYRRGSITRYRSKMIRRSISRTSVELGGSVTEVVDVTVGGLTLDPSAYILEDGHLIRVDGGEWPQLAAGEVPGDGEPGSFVVRVLRGVEVPHGGQIAAGLLACEIAKALCGDSHCRLPERIQTITRQGVTVGFMDQFEGLEDGRTGIWAIDAWVSSVRGAARRVGVASPDYRR